MRPGPGQEFRTAANVSGIAGGRVEGVSFDGGGGVAEGLGQDRYGRDSGQLVEGSQARGVSAEDLGEPGAQMGGVERTVTSFQVDLRRVAAALGAAEVGRRLVCPRSS